MHLQTMPISEYHLNPTNFSTPTRPFSLRPLNHPFWAAVPNPKSKHGFCRSLKRVSESHLVSSCGSDLVGIRCEGYRENASDSDDDRVYIRRCVEIAKKAIGRTNPNPMVGCVIVKDGKVVGEGFHPKAGQPHAEVFALREAGELAENSTAYVSLEPCNHYGRTPPCTEALIRAKVKRVVVGMVDPNPIVASKGLERLESAGIEVKVGVEEQLCKRLNEVFIHHILSRKPFVTLRYSISMNGNISNGLGEGAMESGGYYSQLLQEYDGIILSSASLTGSSCVPVSQEPQCKQPKQIIVASSSISPVKLPLLNQNAGNQPIIFADKNTEIDPEIARHGVETVVLDELHLGPVLDYCERLGLCSVLLDMRGFCGIIEEFVEEGIENGLLQKVVMEVLPVWNGSREAITMPSKNFDRKVCRLAKLQSRMSNGNLLVEGYFR